MYLFQTASTSVLKENAMNVFDDRCNLDSKGKV